MNLTALPQPIPAGAVYSDHLRIEPVISDAMAPTLSCQDFVLCMPTTEFQGDGIYLIDMHGAKVLQRATLQYDGSGSVRLSSDNSACVASWIVSRDKFESVVLAVVVADVKVRDQELLRSAYSRNGRAKS